MPDLKLPLLTRREGELFRWAKASSRQVVEGLCQAPSSVGPPNGFAP
ncbi:MAG TPA: hypothetical protein VFG07_04310 [Thermoplasmata archaeon]|nr:hypothetical protein [Thermoplasmata archaeon]